MADEITGPYRADIWPRNVVMGAGDKSRFNVVGPHIAGGWHGTVPQSHDGMTHENARYLAELMNVAYHAGVSEARRALRSAMGLETANG